MSQYVLALLTVLSILLAGCHTEEVTRATPMPTHYWTALEAYEQITSAMLAWHEDAIVVYISSLPTDQPEWRIRPDGRTAWWIFTIQSPSVSSETAITLLNDDVIVGVDRIPGKEFTIPSMAEGLPIAEMIDSDEAVEIALERGASTSDVLLRMQIMRYDGASDRYIPPSWGLSYANSNDSSQDRRIIIDVRVGDVLRNDIVQSQPTPKPTIAWAPRQIRLLARGELDVYVTDPQGRRLGLDPRSGERVTEIPDAQYESYPSPISETPVRFTEVYVPNPVEGRYRVSVYGPARPEDEPRYLIVEARKETSSLVARDVKISIEQVSSVYEFTFSLSDEELVTDLLLVEE